MHDILTPPTDGGCSKLSPIFPYRPGPSIGKRSVGLPRKGYARELPRSIARLRSHRAIARIIVAIVPILCQIAVSTILVTSAGAQIATRSGSVDRFAEFIEQASARFALPARWIRAVMQVESSGDVHAISSSGAMGLMQLMPGTWVELSVRYGFGLDPFDVSDNILAGAAYLKEMYDRFGTAGFLAAYHAGPARYQQHLTTGQPLPPETAAYVAAVSPLLGNEKVERAVFRIKRAVSWREAPLFVERTEAR